MKLLLTGFLQVFFVAINTYFITKENYAGVVICGFLISLIWTFNVKRVVIGTMKDRLLYSAGASIGSVSGLMVGVILS